LSDLARDGYQVFPYEPAVADWAAAAHGAALQVCQTAGDLRHGGTWRVGVDELPNAADGSINGVPLVGAWQGFVDLPDAWHPAQLSVVYPGYPQQDPDESDAAHGFRMRRDAAHVDGLLPEGADKRRHLREPHQFVLGLSLNDATASPLVVWAGSHHLVKAAFVARLGGIAPADWAEEDVTEIYQATRRAVFETCARVEVRAKPGEAVLLNPHLLHGVAPWGDGRAPDEGRMIAYFRPLVAETADWLA
jgi:hypothetical protein